MLWVDLFCVEPYKHRYSNYSTTKQAHNKEILGQLMQLLRLIQSSCSTWRQIHKASYFTRSYILWCLASVMDHTPCFRKQFPRKLFFFEFNLVYCDLWLQYIQVRKLFKGGNYSRAETIRGNTVFYFIFYFFLIFFWN